MAYFALENRSQNMRRKLDGYTKINISAVLHIQPRRVLYQDGIMEILRNNLQLCPQDRIDSVI